MVKEIVINGICIWDKHSFGRDSFRPGFDFYSINDINNYFIRQIKKTAKENS